MKGLMERLGMTIPLMLAPMARVSGGRLAAAVGCAGGLGFIGGGYGDAGWLQREFDDANGMPVGVGFISWSLALQPELLDLALARMPLAVFLSFGDIAPFVAKVHDAGLPLFAQVQTVDGAREAVAKGADVIVAQGGEAGGHGAARGTLALVSEVRDAIGDIPLVAAGGIADGRGLAAALILGADAVLCGTAFYAADESLAHPRARQAAIEASGDETARSNIFDVARGIDWPTPWTLRARRNAFHDSWVGRQGEMTSEERAAYAKAASEGDTRTAAVIVGEAIGMVRAIEPAAQIASRIADDARRLLFSAPQRRWPDTGDMQ